MTTRSKLMSVLVTTLSARGHDGHAVGTRRIPPNPRQDSLFVEPPPEQERHHREERVARCPRDQGLLERIKRSVWPRMASAACSPGWRARPCATRSVKAGGGSVVNFSFPPTLSRTGTEDISWTGPRSLPPLRSVPCHVKHTMGRSVPGALDADKHTCARECGHR